MDIKSLELNLETLEDQHVARSMYNFWRYQFESAISDLNLYSSQISSMKMANDEALRIFQESDEMTYFGPSLPYSEKDFKQTKKNMDKAEKEYKEAKALYDYFCKFVFNNLKPKEIYDVF